MPTIAPWLQPPDFLGAIKSGSAIGEEIASRAEKAREFDRQLEQEASLKQAAMAQAASEKEAERERLYSQLSLESDKEARLGREFGQNLELEKSKQAIDSRRLDMLSGLGQDKNKTALEIAAMRRGGPMSAPQAKNWFMNSMIGRDEMNGYQQDLSWGMTKNEALSRHPTLMQYLNLNPTPTPTEKLRSGTKFDPLSMLPDSTKLHLKALKDQYHKLAVAGDSGAPAVLSAYNSLLNESVTADDKQIQQRLTEISMRPGTDFRAAQNHLIEYPETSSDFDQQFGKGSAAYILRNQPSENDREVNPDQPPPKPAPEPEFSPEPAGEDYSYFSPEPAGEDYSYFSTAGTYSGM